MKYNNVSSISLEKCVNGYVVGFTGDEVQNNFVIPQTVDCKVVFTNITETVDFIKELIR